MKNRLGFMFVKKFKIEFHCKYHARINRKNYLYIDIIDNNKSNFHFRIFLCLPDNVLFWEYVPEVEQVVIYTLSI